MADDDAVPGRRSLGRRLLKGAAIALAVVVGLVAVALVGARLYLTGPRTRTLAVDTVGKVLQGRLDIGELSWDAFPHAVTLHDVTLDDPAGAEVARIGELHADLGLLALVRKRIELKELDATDVHVTLKKGPEGDYTILDALSPKAPSKPTPQRSGGGWAVDVEDLDLSKVDVELHQPKLDAAVRGASLENGTFALDGPQMQASLDTLAADEVTADVAGHHFEIAYPKLQDLAFHRGQDAARAAASFESFTAQLLGGHLNLSGQVAGLGAGAAVTLDVSGSGVIELSDPALLDLIPASLRTRLAPQGRVRLQASVSGRADAPQVDLTVRGKDLKIVGERVAELALQGAWTGTEATVDSLELRFPEGALSGRARVALAAAPPTFSAHLKAEDLPLRDLGKAFVRPGLLPRRLGGTVDVTGKGLEDPRAQVKLDLTVAGRPSAVPGYVPGTVHLVGEAVATRAGADVKQLSATGQGLSVRLSGRVPFEPAGALDLVVDLDDRQPPRRLRAFGLPATARRLTLHATAGGTLGDPTAQGKLTASGVKTKDLPPMELTAPFTFENGRLTLETATARAAGGLAQVEGSIAILPPTKKDAGGDPPGGGGADPPPGGAGADPLPGGGGAGADPPPGGRSAAPLDANLRLRISDLPVGPYTGGVVTGTLFLTATVRGSLKAPVGQGSVLVRDPAVRGVPLAKVAADIEFRGRTAELTNIVVQPAEGAGGLEGRATVDLEDKTLDASVQASELPLALMAAFGGLDVPVGGVLAFRATAQGPFSDPAYEVKGTASEITVDSAPLGTARLDASGTLQKVQATVSLDGPAGTLSAEGAYDLASESVDGTVLARKVHLDALPGLLPGDGAVASVQGVASGQVSVKGRLPVPENVAGTVRIAGFSLAGPPLETPITLHLAPRPDAPGVTVNADLAGLGSALATLSPGPPLSVRVEGRLEALPVERFVPLLGQYDAEVRTTGTFDATWTGEGGGTRAQVDLSRLDLSLPEGRLSATRPVVVAWDGERLQVKQLALEGPAGAFTASGTVGPSALDLSANGSLEMGLVAPFVPGIARASGTVRLQLRVGGTTDAPSLDGSLSLASPVKLRPRSAVREIVLNTLSVRFVPGEVRLDRLSGTMESGLFTASGQVQLQGLTPGRYALELSGQNLPIRASDLAVELNAELEVSGKGTTAQVKGRTEIVSGRYLQKFELKNFNFVAKQREVSEPISRKYPWLGDISLDVRAVSTGGLEVRVDAGAFATALSLDADLHVTGTAAGPVVDGRVSSEQGNLTFPKAKLDVTRAIVEFQPTASSGIHPTVDLTAEGTVTPSSSTSSDYGAPTYLVTLTLEGNLEQMALDLTSDPQLPRLEILSLLISGRVNPLAASGSDTSAADAALAFAGSQLASPLTRFLEQGLEKTLNLQLNLGAEVSTAGITVTAGKEVTRRLRLEGAYTRTFGEVQTVGTVSARFLLSDRIFLEGSTESVSGQVDLLGAPREGTRSRLELKLRLYGD